VGVSVGAAVLEAKGLEPSLPRSQAHIEVVVSPAALPGPATNAALSPQTLELLGAMLAVDG